MKEIKELLKVVEIDIDTTMRTILLRCRGPTVVGRVGNRDLIDLYQKLLEIQEGD